MVVLNQSWWDLAVTAVEERCKHTLSPGSRPFPAGALQPPHPASRPRTPRAVPPPPQAAPAPREPPLHPAGRPHTPCTRTLRAAPAPRKPPPHPASGFTCASLLSTGLALRTTAGEAGPTRCFKTPLRASDTARTSAALSCRRDESSPAGVATAHACGGPATARRPPRPRFPPSGGRDSGSATGRARPPGSLVTSGVSAPLWGPAHPRPAEGSRPFQDWRSPAPRPCWTPAHLGWGRFQNLVHGAPRAPGWPGLLTTNRPNRPLTENRLSAKNCK